MFNVGGPEIMVILFVALIVLGPEQLPKAMRTFGNATAQVRKVSSGFQDEMRNAMNTIENPTTVSDAVAGPSAKPPVVAPATAPSDTSERASG